LDGEHAAATASIDSSLNPCRSRFSRQQAASAIDGRNWWMVYELVLSRRLERCGRTRRQH
jgi:hypothetical protein